MIQLPKEGQGALSRAPQLMKRIFHLLASLRSPHTEIDTSSTWGLTMRIAIPGGCGMFLTLLLVWSLPIPSLVAKMAVAASIMMTVMVPVTYFTLEKPIYREFLAWAELARVLRKAAADLEQRVQERTTDLVALQKAKEALCMKTLLLEAQAETSIDGILVVDDADRIVFVNKQFGLNFGIPDELLSTPDDLIVRKFVADEVEEPDAFLEKVKYLNSRTHEKSRDELRFKSGKTFDRYSAPLVDSKGNYRGRIWYFREITDRKRAETLLQESESKHRALFEESADANLLMAEKGFLDCNAAALKMFGYSTKAEFLALHPAEFSPTNQPDGTSSREGSERNIATAFLKGKNRFEWMHQRKDGEVFPAEVCITALTLNGRQAQLGTVRDISERVRAERDLHLQSTALNAAANAIVITDARGTIQWANPAFTRLTGYLPEEAVGQNPRILQSGMHDESFYRNIWNTILGGDVWTGEITNRKKDGGLYIEEMTIAPVRSATGEMANFIAIKQDITERKRAQADLVKAKEGAEAANRAKSEFLANMSHEIRTPMNGIIGMTDLALDTELDPEQSEYLNMVKGSADALLTLLNDILDFSKIEAGKLELDCVSFNLRKSLGEVVKTLAIRAQQKGLELILDVAPEVPTNAAGDPGRLRQVLVNLVGNAIKFTERGEIEVRVQPEAPSPGGPTLRFSIRDTGIGIPADKQQKIFDAFTQADSSTTRKYGGSGLGLAISVQLVGLMGGKLWVESEAGKGSTFYFTAQVGQGTAALPSESFHESELAGVPIVVVDDNATNRRILEESVIRWNMMPTVVESAAAAMEVLQRARSSGARLPLVLTDAHMPDIDGFGLVEGIREDPSLSNVRIVMLTSGGEGGDAERCRKLGVTAYVSKPFDRSELRDVLLHVIAGDPAKPESRPLLTRHLLQEQRQSLCFLLAEDNIVNQMVIMRLLEKRGHSVVRAKNGREALDAMAKQPFDIVLMDVQMPEMDGFEATRLIREKETVSGTHSLIIALTAHVMQGDKERCLAAGMDGYIAKPVQSEGLFREVDRLRIP